MRKALLFLLFFVTIFFNNRLESYTDEERKIYFAQNTSWPDAEYPGFASITELINYGWIWTPESSIIPVFSLNNAYLSSLDGILSVTGITDVVEFTCNVNTFTYISEELYTLTNLQILNLEYNQITTIPTTIDQLIFIKRISLHHNNINTLPDALATMTWLEGLDLRYNNIMTLPTNWIYETSLPFTLFDENPIISIERKKIFATTSVWPYATMLSFTSITELIDYGWTWTPSTFLNLSSCGLESLDGIATLTDIHLVEEIDLNYNFLPEIPAFICTSLPNLQQLYVAHNELNTLPSNINQAINLAYLDAQDNQITSIPDSLITMPSLITCNLNDNNIITISSTMSYTTLTAFTSLNNNPIKKKAYFATNKIWDTYINETFTSFNELKQLGWESPSNQYLNLHGAHLLSLDGIETLSYANEILSLNASNNNLTSLSSSITALTSLVTLNLYDNFLSEVPAFLNQFPELADLSLGKNRITSFDTSFFTAPSLIILDLHSNLLTELPSLISNLTHLEALNIAGNLLADLPYTMTGMPLLNSCNMEFNQCFSLSDTMQYLKNIFSIQLLGNPMQEYLPVQPRNDTLDRKLFFIQNRYWKDGIIIGFDSVEELLSLGWTNKAHYGLDLYNAGLKSLRGIAQIPDITSYDVLYAHNNTFTEIPAEVVAMTNLRVVHLENNNIQAIDPALANLVALEEIYARNNSLTDVPAGIYLAPEVRILDLSLNLCVTLTDALYTMTHLKKLFLNSNELTSMPANIDQLSKLTELQINDNWLTSLPRGIGKMNKLSYLHIENNEFTSIPASFAANAQIFCVNACKNKFSSLPETISTNTHIAYLNVDFTTTDPILDETLNRLNPNRQNRSL